MIMLPGLYAEFLADLIVNADLSFLAARQTASNEEGFSPRFDAINMEHFSARYRIPVTCLSVLPMYARNIFVPISLKSEANLELHLGVPSTDF